MIAIAHVECAERRRLIEPASRVIAGFSFAADHTVRRYVNFGRHRLDARPAGGARRRCAGTGLTIHCHVWYDPYQLLGWVLRVDDRAGSGKGWRAQERIGLWWWWW